MHAYRSDLAAASERIAALEEQLEAQERAARSSDRGRRVAMAAGFVAATFAAGFAMSRSSAPEAPDEPLAAAQDAEDPVVEIPAWSPVLQRLKEKIENGSANQDERDAVVELESLSRQLVHAQRKASAMRRYAEGRADRKDLSFLHQSCVLGGEGPCESFAAHAVATRQ